MLDIFALRMRIRHRGDFANSETAAPSTATANPSRSRVRGWPGRRRDRHARWSGAALLPRPPAAWRPAPCRSTMNICGSGRAPGRRRPPALHSAGHWLRRRARRWRGRHLAGERRVALGAAAGQPRCGARAQPLDRGANDDVRQRHPFGGADDPGNEAHVTTPFLADPRQRDRTDSPALRSAMMSRGCSGPIATNGHQPLRGQCGAPRSATRRFRRRPGRAKRSRSYRPSRNCRSAAAPSRRPPSGPKTTRHGHQRLEI